MAMNSLAILSFSAADADSRRPRVVEAVWLVWQATQNDCSPVRVSVVATMT